jgi:hypothetical protein
MLSLLSLGPPSPLIQCWVYECILAAAFSFFLLVWTSRATASTLFRGRGGMANKTLETRSGKKGSSFLHVHACFAMRGSALRQRYPANASLLVGQPLSGQDQISHTLCASTLNWGEGGAPIVRFLVILCHLWTPNFQKAMFGHRNIIRGCLLFQSQGCGLCCNSHVETTQSSARSPAHDIVVSRVPEGQVRW